VPDEKPAEVGADAGELRWSGSAGIGAASASSIVAMVGPLSVLVEAPDFVGRSVVVRRRRVVGLVGRRFAA
jgi:hypothetical protein